MASIKAKKGNPFEYDTAYSLKEGGWDVARMDDNSAGVDLVATTRTVFEDGAEEVRYGIECKNRQGLTWNALKKIYEKTCITLEETDMAPCVVFKSNRQPTLVFSGDAVYEFESYFGCKWQRRPKGYKIWKE